MLFSDFITLCQKIHNENKRNKKKLIFKDFILEMSPSNIADIFTLYNIIEKNEYLTQIQEKQCINIVASFFHIDQKNITHGIQQSGDLAQFITALSLNHKGNIISLKTIIETIYHISQTTGKNSVEKKKELINQIWNQCNTNEISYFIKIILGKLNIGLSIKSILEIFFDIAHSHEQTITKHHIEYAFGISGDLFELYKLIINKEYHTLQHMMPSPGKFIACQSAEVYFKDKTNLDIPDSCYYIQPKLDGFRLQLHINNHGNISLFSRNGIIVSNMYPELLHATKTFTMHNNISSMILDGEVIGYDFTNNCYLEFQETAKRKRKFDIDKTCQTHSVKYIVFDVLYLNGNSFLNFPYEKRYNTLKELRFATHIEKIDNQIVHNSKEIQSLYNIIGSTCEGIMIKKANSIYQPGKRTRTWLKYKNVQKDSLEDTIDVVILGYWYAKGIRHKKQTIGSVLVGYYDQNKDIFVTIAQVGTGGSAALWKEIIEMIEPKKINTLESNVIINAIHIPDVLVLPEMVIGLKADYITISKEHTSGYSLRFPRIVSIRKDKTKYMTHVPGIA